MIYIYLCDRYDISNIVMKYEIMNLKSTCDRKQRLIWSEIRSLTKIY